MAAAKGAVEIVEVEMEAEVAGAKAGRAEVLETPWGGSAEVMVAGEGRWATEVVETARVGEDLAPGTVGVEVVGRVAVKAAKAAVVMVAVEAVAMEGAAEGKVRVKAEGWVEARDTVVAGRGRGVEATVGAAMGDMGRPAFRCCYILRTRSHARWCNMYPTTNGHGSLISR